ncbi:MAG: hypothetical protein LBF65_02075 [Holosporales bacterium]|jgi:hypothetical protein|nr:hypothetical protein [Holosporales bacterium]
MLISKKIVMFVLTISCALFAEGNSWASDESISSLYNRGVEAAASSHLPEKLVGKCWVNGSAVKDGVEVTVTGIRINGTWNHIHLSQQDSQRAEEYLDEFRNGAEFAIQLMATILGLEKPTPEALKEIIRPTPG